MKRLSILLLTPLLIIATATHAEDDGNDATREVEEIAQEAQNAKPQVILHSIANIVAHIGSIVGNPHNKPNVGQNVTGILGNIVNIALAASHRGLKTEEEFMAYFIDELHLDQELRAIIEQEAQEIRRTLNSR